MFATRADALAAVLEITTDCGDTIVSTTVSMSPTPPDRRQARASANRSK